MKTLAIAALALALVACGPTPQPQYTPEPVQQAPVAQDGFDGGDAALGAVAGAAAGYMMGRGSSQDRYYDQRRVAPRTIIVDRRGSRYMARPQTRIVTKTVIKKGWGGRTTITKTVTKRRR